MKNTRTIATKAAKEAAKAEAESKAARESKAAALMQAYEAAREAEAEALNALKAANVNIDTIRDRKAEAEAKAAKTKGAKTKAKALKTIAKAEADEAKAAKMKKSAKAAHERAKEATAAALLKATNAEKIAAAPRFPFGAYVRLETEADRAAHVADNETRAAREAYEADPTNETKAEAVKRAEAVAKIAHEAAKEAAKTAPRYSYDLTAGSIKEAHERATAAHEAATDEAAARISVHIHYTTNAGTLDPDRVKAAAEHIAKKAASNMVTREGTPTQYRIDRAARRGDFNDFDLAEMVSEAKTALMLATTADPDRINSYKAAAAALLKCAALLDDISPADLAAAEMAVERAQKIAPEAINDPAQNRRRARLYEATAEAAAILQADPTDPESRRAALEIATRAAYMYINSYLTEARAVRTKENPPALSLEDLTEVIDPRDVDPAAIDEATAARRALLKRAFVAVFEALSPRAASVFRLMYKGCTVEQIARKLNIKHPTVCEHIRVITQTTAEVLATLDPEAVEAAAANFAAITAEIEAAEATAALEARRKAAKAAKKQEATKAAKEAAANALETTKAEAEAKEATAAAERAARISEAIEAAENALTPTARKVYNCFKSGAGTRKTAAILSKGLATIDEHKKNITRKIAAAIIEAAPEIDPAIIEAADLAALLKLAK